MVQLSFAVLSAFVLGSLVPTSLAATCDSNYGPFVLYANTKSTNTTQKVYMVDTTGNGTYTLGVCGTTSCGLNPRYWRLQSGQLTGFFQSSKESNELVSVGSLPVSNDSPIKLSTRADPTVISSYCATPNNSTSSGTPRYLAANFASQNYVDPNNFGRCYSTSNPNSSPPTQQVIQYGSTGTLPAAGGGWIVCTGIFLVLQPTTA